MSKYSNAFKTKVAIEAIKEKETIETLAKRFGIAPMKVVEWKEDLLANAEQAFEKPAEAKRELSMVVNAKRVRRLLRKMGIWAIYPRKCLSKGGAAKYVHTYLLRGLEITRFNQVWSTDISYIPMKGGFMYLYAIIDVYSRYIVEWRLSNTLSARNCYELLEESIALYGAPEIVNSDQGSQYATQSWKDLLEKHHVKISMDGRGRCKDNIWIERFWRSVKQEYVYLNPTDNVEELRHGIRDYIDFYNYRRPHQSLDVLIPAMKYGIVA